MVSRLFLKGHSLRNVIVRSLETSITKTYDRIGHLSEFCPEHNLRDHPQADACPCQVELFFKLDRLDEAIHRLKDLKHWVVRWWVWYIRSSTRSFGFPKESILVWSQTGQPIAAWQKYSIAQRNGEVEPRNRRAYIYYKGGREISARSAAATNSN